MCFHNSLTIEAIKLEHRFDAQLLGEYESLYHEKGFGFEKRPIITTEKPQSIQLYNWGLIPHWMKTLDEALKFRGNTLNAVSETVFDKPSFKFSIMKKRCLVPSTGFYEWQDVKGKKYPYFIHLKNEEIFAMAGIYQNWTDNETGEIFNTFSILTTEANPLMATIHNLKKRMPVIIPKEREKEWLNPDLTKEEITSFLAPYDETKMEAHTISKLITSRSENSNVPEVQKEFIYSVLL